jgi:hypothetical protein
MNSVTVANHRSADQQRKSNVRLALVLASVALVFFVGFVTKIVLLGR